jgi:hypothetical protein
MDGETQRQIAELEERRTAHRDRLQVLEIQSARMGRSTPPEIVTEVAEIKSKLVPIDAAIFKLTYVGTVRSDTPDNERHDHISMAVERALERHRRASVAAQTDQLMYLNVRLDAALREVRQFLLVIGSAALIGMVAGVIALYLVTKGG